jgi:hypothetical protein
MLSVHIVEYTSIFLIGISALSVVIETFSNPKSIWILSLNILIIQLIYVINYNWVYNFDFEDYHLMETC